MITKNTIKPLALAVLMAGAAGCEPEIEREFPANASGEADFSRYVALGNSLTAGMADARLNRAGQVNSYPAILADKMAAVTPDFTFTQPLMPAGVVDGTLQLTIVGYDAEGKPIISIAPSQGGISPIEAGAPVRGTFQNLGVPDAKAADLTRTEMQTDRANYFFNRFAQTGKTVVQMAAEQNPTFFTLWIGANDVLEWATSGGEDNPGTPHTEAITDPAAYRASLEAAVAGLKEGNPSIEGALGNITSISAIPFFNVVPWNAFVLTSQAQVDQLNAGFAAQINPVIRQKVIFGATIQVISTEQVFTEKYLQERAAGATHEEALATASNYIQTAEGQSRINNYVSSLTTSQTPAELFQQVQTRYNEALKAEADTDANTTLVTVFGKKLGEGFGTLVANKVEQTQNEQITQLKAAKLYPVFQLGPNGFVVASNDSPTGLKQLTAAEKMLLTFQNRTTEEFNPATGKVIVPDKYALDIFEIQQVNAAIAAYNQHIAEVAAANTFALVDMHEYFNQLITADGISIDGVRYNADYADISDVDTGQTTGDGVTVFSLDGVHPNQRGYAITARRFAEVINQYYGANLPLPQPSNYPLLPLPATAPAK